MKKKCEYKNPLTHNLDNLKLETKCKDCGLSIKQIYLDEPFDLDLPPKPKPVLPIPKINLFFWRKDKTKEQLKLKKLFETEKEVIVLQEAKMFQLPSLKIDSFIFHEKINGSNNLKFSPLTNYTDILKTKGSAFALYKETFKVNDKPAFLLKNGYPMNLNLETIQIESQMTNPKEDYELVFDDKGFNTLLDFATYSNLKIKSDKNAELWSFISENWIALVIMIIVSIVLFATPQGKEFLQNFLTSIAQTGKPV